MHFSIDVLRTDTPASLAPLWKAAAEAQATKSGFNVAKLHKVYKTLNRDSYDFVSIEQWRDMETCRAAQTTVELYQYIVNQSFYYIEKQKILKIEQNLEHDMKFCLKMF